MKNLLVLHLKNSEFVIARVSKQISEDIDLYHSEMEIDCFVVALLAMTCTD